jgi:electron transfer flavoprotein alpha subunit
MIFLHLLTVQNGGIKRSSLEVLSRGRELVDSISQSNGKSSGENSDQNSPQSAGNQGELHAVVCSPEVAGWDEAKWAAELGAYGVDTVWSATDEAFKEHNNQALLSAMQSAHAQATDQGAKPSVVAMASTEGVKDILGALSMRLGASVVADVSEFGVVAEGDGVLLTATRPVMASKANTHVRAQAQHVMVSVRSGSYGILENGENQNAKPLNHQPVRIVPLKIERADSKLQTQIREIITAAADTIDLNEAEAIVAAGRGVKDEAAKALIAELAGVLNAGIGASRALTEAGMYDPSVQIGQTGKVVSPQLYIAVGISGAIQHVAGITNSKVIVAVNKDADAPIFEVADYGIVGDLYEVLPALIAEIKRVKG